MPIKHIPKKALLLFLGDVLLFVESYLVSWFIRFGDLNPDPWGIAFTAGAYALTYYLADLYNFEARSWSARSLARVILAALACSFVLAVSYYLFPRFRAGRGVFLLNAVLVCSQTWFWGLLVGRRFSGTGGKRKKVVIAGAGWAGRTMYEALRDRPEFKVVGFVDDNRQKHGTSFSPKVLGDSSVLGGMLMERGVDAVVIAITHLKGQELLKNALNCKMSGVDVCDMPSFYEELTGKVPVEHVDDYWFVSAPVSGVRKTVYNTKVKRLLDLIFSVSGLILSLPISAMTALAIKLESKGPVFYRQKRAGYNGKGFEIIKFRSMRADAEPHGAVWAGEDDPRITRVGRIIRKTRIDEIPQMWNVLKGAMSFIGPRPERPEFVAQLSEEIPFYSLRHTVKPGITGWAQVNYKYGASKSDAVEKLRYELFYIKNLSPLLDMHILLKTVRVVLFGLGAR